MTSDGSASGAGRFAPSPTGPLHMGSLLAAVASYLDARHHGIPWRVRFDDLDEPRNQPGAEADILRALEGHGLTWDGAYSRQSDNGERYRAALDILTAEQRLFYCRCPRRKLAGLPAYPGTCRAHRSPRPDSAVRVQVDDAVIAFDDAVQGPQRHVLAETGGDFIVRRRDGIIAYQLATAVDDGAPDIARVVRGRDLLETTPRQIYLMGCLGASIPRYGHIPLLVNAAGQKLSKQHHAPPLELHRARDNLARVLTVLGMAPERGAAADDCPGLLAQALPRWSLAGVPRQDSAMAP